MADIQKCFAGPTLFGTFHLQSSEIETTKYVPNSAESFADGVNSCITMVLSAVKIVSPLIAYYFVQDIIYQPSSLPNDLWHVIRFSISIGSLLAFAEIPRTIGRYLNQNYIQFITHLDEVKEIGFNVDTKISIAKFDFDFDAWPVEFAFDDNQIVGRGRFKENPEVERSLIETAILLFPMALAWIAVHAGGIYLVYPGSIPLIKFSLRSFIAEHRVDWIWNRHGERFKLEAKDGNIIDTMFIDKRESGKVGETLVIACEGNGSCYEIGCAQSAAETGHSCLGWNHPGFGCSTGTPYPIAEMNAADVVMQFAIQKLGFPPHKILVYGWSIGGFAASWIAMNYPDVGGVLLDATFDEAKPIAMARMPFFLGPMVSLAVEEFINMDVARQICYYNGPVRIIRRMFEDMITTEPGKPASNRGNNLLVKLLRHRYPAVFDEASTAVVEAFLALDEVKEQSKMLRSFAVQHAEMQHHLLQHISTHENTFPLDVGSQLDSQTRRQLALYLTTKYLTDFEASHNEMLPPELFLAPWNPFLGSVFTPVGTKTPSL